MTNIDTDTTNTHTTNTTNTTNTTMGRFLGPRGRTAYQISLVSLM